MKYEEAAALIAKEKSGLDEIIADVMQRGEQGDVESVQALYKRSAAFSLAIEALKGCHPRSFDVQTPAGIIRAYAKADYGNPKAKQDKFKNEPENFPGVFVDLVLSTGESVILACTEWESCDKKLQTCVYGDCMADEPTFIGDYTNIDEAINDGEGN